MMSYTIYSNTETVHKERLTGLNTQTGLKPSEDTPPLEADQPGPDFY